VVQRITNYLCSGIAWSPILSTTTWNLKKRVLAKWWRVTFCDSKSNYGPVAK